MAQYAWSMFRPTVTVPAIATATAVRSAAVSGGAPGVTARRSSVPTEGRPSGIRPSKLPPMSSGTVPSFRASAAPSTDIGWPRSAAAMASANNTCSRRFVIRSR